MKTLIIGLVCIISPLYTFGHNPLSARYHLEAGDHVSLLTINLSQDGINHALIKKHGKEMLETIGQNEFKTLIVAYVKSNFNLIIDGEEIILQKGGIKLGRHQTDLKFVLPPISKKAEQLDINISAFKENENHQTIFSHNIKEEASHVILRSQNDYRSTFNFSEPVESNNWLFIVFVGLLTTMVIGLIKVYIANKQLNEPILRV